MSMSNIQAVGVALVPGVAERLEYCAGWSGDMRTQKMAQHVINTRHVSYVSGVSTAIAIAIFFGGSEEISRCICGVFFPIGVCVTTMAVGLLYEKTVNLQSNINFTLLPRFLVRQVPVRDN